MMRTPARLRVVAGRDTAELQTPHERQRLYARLPGEQAVSFLENLSDAVYLLDADWRFSFVNRAAAALWRRDRAGLIGKRIWDAFPQAAESASRRMHERAAAGHRAISFESLSPILDTWVHVSIRPIDRGLGVCFCPIDRPGKRGRLLIVEDQEQVRELLRMTLEQEGYLVLHATDLDCAEVAVDLLAIDAVLLDDRLPGGRGLSLHEPAARRGVKLLLMSGHPASIAQLSGAGNFIAKPFRLAALIGKLDHLLKNSP